MARRLRPRSRSPSRRCSCSPSCGAGSGCTCWRSAANNLVAAQNTGIAARSAAGSTCPICAQRYHFPAVFRLLRHRKRFRLATANWGKTPLGSATRMKYSYLVGSVAIGTSASLHKRERNQALGNMIDPLYVASGFGVGLLVGMTGVGGGSLMTPLLILLFGIHPSTAVGTDLLYAAATKTGGGLIHGWARSIHWPAVIRLACGSIPASIATMLVMWKLDLDAHAQSSLINIVLCFALLLTATALVFRKAVIERYRRRLERITENTTAVATVLTGALLGVLVSISSVGAGAVGVTALLLLYPRLPMVQIVASDIVHAVPLTLVAGTRHWARGSVDWQLIGVLLVGAPPRIAVGSYGALR